MKLPQVIASSVVRSTQQGESHGGVYLVDLESGESKQVIDWNDPGIDWQGRGSDRGLRGIAFYQDNVYLAASDELFLFDPGFRLRRSFRNPYLKHCHEICREGPTLYLTSTGFNAVLEFDLEEERFTRGFQLRERRGIGKWFSSSYPAISFDPLAPDGPIFNSESSNLHLNNVSRYRSATHVAGTKLEALLELGEESAAEFSKLPRGTHNAAASPGGGVIFNDTARGAIVLADRELKVRQSFEVPTYDPAELTHTDIPRDHARQGFARGLISLNDELIIGGSSPSTISVYSIPKAERVCSVNLSKDIRNCIHGLEVWPF